MAATVRVTIRGAPRRSEPWGWYASAPPVLWVGMHLLLRSSRRHCYVVVAVSYMDLPRSTWWTNIHALIQGSTHAPLLKMVGEMKRGPALRWWCWICSEVRKMTSLSTHPRRWLSLGSAAAGGLLVPMSPVAVQVGAAGADVAGGRADRSCWC